MCVYIYVGSVNVYVRVSEVLGRVLGQHAWCLCPRSSIACSVNMRDAYARGARSHARPTSVVRMSEELDRLLGQRLRACVRGALSRARSACVMLTSKELGRLLGNRYTLV